MDRVICIAGKNEIALSSAEYFRANFPEKKLICAVNKNDDSQDGWQPSFKKYCQNNNLEIWNLAELALLDNLIFISLEYDQIIPVEDFKSNELFNIHFSKLPKYKGMYTSCLPLLHGEKTSGVTLHKIDAGIDTGDIVDQKVFTLQDLSDARGLYFRYLKFGKELFRKNISSLLSGRYNLKQQAKAGSSYFSKKSVDFSKVVIDLNKTAYEIHNQIRAFCFKEFQLPLCFGEEIVKSAILDTKSDKIPGSILSRDKSSIVISTIDYDLQLFCLCRRD